MPRAGDVRDRRRQVQGFVEGRARHGEERERLRRDGVGRQGLRAHVAPEGSLRSGLLAQSGRVIERGPPRPQEEPQTQSVSA